VTGEEQRALWGRHVCGESWKDIRWFPAVEGHPRSGEVDPDGLQEVLCALHVPRHAVAGVCPWPGEHMIDRAIRDGHLAILSDDDLFRVVITPQAKDALARPPAWPDARFNPGRELAAEARRACQYATLVPFAAYLRAEFGNITALAMMHPREQGRDIVLTLWSQVRRAALAAGKAERAWVQAEYDAGRDPFPGP
jgi:hypothetical protein